MLQRVISIMQEGEPRCYICGTTQNLELHHAMHGYANRKLADRYHLVVWLCADHHRGKIGVHNDIVTDERIKRDAQFAFEQIYGHSAWMRVFRKNYL